MTPTPIAAFRYAYSSATVSALRSKLLSPDQYKRLIGSETLGDALESLRQTHYGSVTSDLKVEGDPGLMLDQAIYREIDLNMSRVLRASPKKVQPFLMTIVEQAENRALKSILKSMAAGVGTDYAAPKITPFGRVTPEVCLEILRDGSVDKALGYARDPALRRTLTQILGEKREEDLVFEIDTAVERQSALKIVSESNQLRGTDREWMKILLGYEADIRNIISSLRAINYGLSAEKARRFWIPFHRYVREPELVAMVNTGDLAKAVTLVPEIYRGIFQGQRVTERGFLTFVETLSERYLASRYFSAFAGDRMHVGIIWAYLRLLMYEAADLRMIMIGKIYGLRPPEIEKNLVLTVT